MKNESGIIGIILILIGIIILFFSRWPAIILIAIGIIFVILRNDENKIEKRKDLKETKTKK